MARILFLETAAGYGGSINSLLATLRGGLSSSHRCTVGFYSDQPLEQDFVMNCAEVIRIRSRIAASGAAQLAARTHRLNRWRQGVLGANRVSRLLEVVFKCPEIAVRVLPLSRVVADIIAAYGIELVHVNGCPSLNLDGILAAARTKIPCVCHLRSPQTLNMLETNLAGRIVNRFIAVSYAMEDYYVQQGLPPDRITVIYNAREPVPANPDLQAKVRSSLGTENGHVVFAFAGRLLTRKGVGILLESASRLERLRQGFCVWIVGDGGEKEAWVRRAEQLGIQDKTRFLGYRAGVPSILAAADVVVVPSLIPDAFPSSVLEAMAVGRPVIASRIGGIPEAVVDGVTGIMFAPGEIEDLARKMAYLMDAPEVCSAMGLAAQERLRVHFDPVRQARSIDRIYQDVLSRRSTPRDHEHLPALQERSV